MENNQSTSGKACCSTDQSSCKRKRCCVGKAIGALLILGLVAGAGYCVGTRQAQAKPTAQSAASLPAQASNDTPVLRP